MKHLLIGLASLIPHFPTTNTVTHSCPQYEAMLTIYQPHTFRWDVKWMSRRMWTESRCRPTAVNGAQGGHDGLFQISRGWDRQLTKYFGVPFDRATLIYPELNIAAAAWLCQRYVDRGAHGGCYGPWGGR